MYIVFNKEIRTDFEACGAHCTLCAVMKKALQTFIQIHKHGNCMFKWPRQCEYSHVFIWIACLWGPLQLHDAVTQIFQTNCSSWSLSHTFFISWFSQKCDSPSDSSFITLCGCHISVSQDCGSSLWCFAFPWPLSQSSTIIFNLLCWWPSHCRE